MPEIEVNEEQYAFLEELRASLAEEHVGAYGHVRAADAVQFLIDHYDGDIETPDPPAGNAEDEAEEGDDNDDGDADDGGGGTPEDPTDRLNAMMELLDTHDDKWEEADAEDARYVVTLPDDEEERVQTKDDVRAVLFKHYG